MRKIAKVLLCISCLLPLTCLVAFAEDGGSQDVNFVDVVSEVTSENSGHIDDTYVPGFVYVGDILRYNIPYRDDLGFCIPDLEGLDVGDVVVFYSSSHEYLIFDVVEVSAGDTVDRTVLEPRSALSLESITSSYYLQHYDPVNPVNFVSLISDWIIGCFGTVAFVLTDFAADNEWITLFLLVIPLSGLIFSFVKSLIARR